MVKRTSLYEEHKKLNARLTEFGGWDMPLMYTTIMDEHNTVRTKAGIFDASHMGEFIISGPGADDFISNVTAADTKLMKPLQAKYSFLLNEHAGIIDDLIIYKREHDFLIVVNAGNLDKDFAWFESHKPEEVKFENISDDVSLIAIQGPEAVKILQQIVKNDLSKAPYFSCLIPEFNFIEPEFAMACRTGYTGEDGFEDIISNENAPELWSKFIELGAKPCGLGARDSLRLEAAMPLHGHDINDITTPLEAGLGWAINWEHDFTGKAVLLNQKEKGLSKFFKCFILENGIARENSEIIHDGKIIGKVASGGFSPTLKKAVCMGYVTGNLEIGTIVEITVHGQHRKAETVKRPFYKRQRSA